MRCRSLLLIVALWAAHGTAIAQSPNERIQELEAKLARVLENQNRLAAENEDLRGRMGSLSAAQDLLRAENEELKAGGPGAMLEEHVNTLVSRYAATTVDSQASAVTLTGELRFRTVWARVEGTGEGYWTDARARLGFGYQFAEGVSAQVDVQSHWGFGDGAPTEGDVNFGILNFGETTTNAVLYQAYIQTENLFGIEDFNMRLGRQEIVLGNQFQFGNADWYSGWVFDGFRFDYGKESWNITGLALKLGSIDLDVNQLHSAFTTHDDDELYALYGTFDLNEEHTLDAYWIYVNGHGGAGSGTTVSSLGTSVGGGGLGGGTQAYFNTFGARIAGTFDVAAGLDYNVEAAVQFGSVKNGGPVDDVFGWAVEAEVGLTFDADSAFRVFVRFLYASGPEDDESGYVPLYPNRHSNSGFMARYGLLDALPMVNVITPQIGFTVSPVDKWVFGGTFIYSFADERIAGGDDEWGWEVDLFAAYVYSDNLTFTFAGFAVNPGDQLQALTNINDNVILGLVFQARLTF